MSGSPAPTDLVARSVAVPGGTFLFGHRYDWLHPCLKERDERRGLGLRSLLHGTPPRWVHLPPFRVGRRLVSNGEYRAFVQDPLYESADLWEAAWQAFPLKEVTRSRATPTGEGLSYVESFSGARNAVEAYLDSLEREVTALLGPPDGGPAGGDRAPAEGVGEVFAHVRAALEAVVPGRSGALSPHVVARVDALVERLRAYQRHHVERHLHDAVGGRFPLEAEQLLSRLRAAVATTPSGPLALRDVLHPRAWRSPAGEAGPSLGRQRVAWEERPVLGITLYEALAYCIWLEERSEDGVRVGLPNEAQLERVAGWTPPEDGRLEPRHKDLCPWGDDGPDLLDRIGGGEFFQPEGADHLLRRDAFEAAVRATGRSVGGDRVEMLLGFAWQWTADRYAPSTEHLLAPCDDPQAQAPIDGSPVHRYAGCTDPSRSLAAVRGAPPLVGGPALSTRRFALPPLRACTGTGFRWVAWRERV